MWISRKRFKALEQRLADVEDDIKAQGIRKWRYEEAIRYDYSTHPKTRRIAIDAAYNVTEIGNNLGLLLDYMGLCIAIKPATIATRVIAEIPPKVDDKPVKEEKDRD